MSFDSNYKFWIATQKDLEDVLKRQEVFKALKPTDDKAVTHYIFAELYARYVQLVNKLGFVYHHAFQVQKRYIIKDLVEASTQRLLELKNELKKLELSEFVYIDKTLIERRLTPDDITVWTPKYFPYWRSANIQEMIDRTRKSKTESDPTYPEVEKPIINETQKIPHKWIEKSSKHGMQAPEYLLKQRLKSAVILIQTHERARCGRRYLTNIRYNPELYKPKIREDVKVKYEFTHKRTQEMLFPVERTRFDANYYIQKKDIGAFNYYKKPFHPPVHLLIEDELSELEDSEAEQIDDEKFNVELEEHFTDEIDSSQYDEETNGKECFKNKIHLSAQRIQSFWRGYRDRKKYRALLERKLLIYGMAQEFRPKSNKLDVYKELMLEAKKHRALKEKFDDEFARLCEDERIRILRIRGPWIMEDISDNVRMWFREFYDKLNCFHPYPDEVKGGTILLVREQTMDVFEYQNKLNAGKLTKDQKQKIKEKEIEQKKKLKEKLKKEKLEEAKKKAQLEAAGIFDFNYEMQQSKSIAAIENTISKYKKHWEDIDEKLNKNHEPIKEWITSDCYAEIHQELQMTVDEFMRLEYDLLQRALAYDKNKKYKPPKVKKAKTKRGKKKTIPKDITADRSIESLYYELQDAGIVKSYPRKTFDDFIGERNHCAFDMLNIQMKDTPPFKGDIKDVLKEYVLGLGALSISKPKSICLVGPTHSGKSLLCDILATEIDAVVLDISPENTVKYQSNLKYFVHIITKMAKILQPTILYISDVHRVFWKKIPKEYADLNPRILQSQLGKYILKPLKMEDKVFVLGTSNAPWTANAKMKKTFQKILLVPKTDYATSFFLRQQVTLQTPGIPRDFNFSALAMVTRDYSTGELVSNIKETLCLRRRMDLARNPLHPMEFIDNFVGKDRSHFPPDLQEWEKFQKWSKKASKMAKSRAEMIEQRGKQNIKK